jgi:UDP-arabinose 4-epimerase
MNGTPILVTGGAGYIGSHTCKALAARGFEPITYDNLSRGHADAVRWGPLVVGDLLDQARLGDTLSHYKPVAVIHFAGVAYVGESFVEPASYYRNNVVGTQSLLDACVAHGMPRIVFSSSCATYGIPPSLPIREDAPQLPISPYGRSKLVCEYLIRDYANAYRMRFAILRYFNASGADPEGQASERHDPETHLIPLALRAAAGGNQALEIFGNAHPTADGTCVRDFVHVTDLAIAHVRATEYLLCDGASTALNLGSGRGHSILDVVREIRAVTGREVRTTIGKARAGDPPILVADASAARATLQFTPQLSDMATIVRSAAPSFGLGVR